MWYRTFGTRKKADVARDKNKRSYFFQAIGLLVYACIMLGVYSDFHNTLSTYGLDSPDSLNTLISGCTFIIVGTGLAIGFYCCDCYDLIKFVIGVLIIVGGLIYIAGCKTFLDSYRPSCDEYCKSGYYAESVLLLLVCIIVGVQVGFEFLNPENRRIGSLSLAIAIFCGMILAYYYNQNQDYLGDEEKSIESGATILIIACICTMIIFLVPNMEGRLFRIILTVGIACGAIILFGGYSGEANNISGSDSFKIYAMRAGILALIESVLLAIDIFF